MPPNKKNSQGFVVREDIRKKWDQLGILKLQKITQRLQDVAGSDEEKKNPLNLRLSLGFSKAVPSICGQLDSQGICQGVGKKIAPYSIYEGCFKNDKRHGYGRAIYSSYHYEGEWKNDKMHGFGRHIDQDGLI